VVFLLVGGRRGLIEEFQERQMPVLPRIRTLRAILMLRPEAAREPLPCHLAQNLGAVLENRTCRTSPPRPLSATATQTVALCTSNPTYVISSIRPVPHA
jgi:hypothetical protein